MWVLSQPADRPRHDKDSRLPSPENGTECIVDLRVLLK